MNLELLDPFGRQVPDRVDATLHLPDALHPSQDKAALVVSFNRRGMYAAVAYQSGVVAVYSILTRTLVSLFAGNHSNNHTANGNTPRPITSVSWSRRSRTILTGDGNTIRCYDTTHPSCAQDCSAALVQISAHTDSNNHHDDNNNNNNTNTNNGYTSDDDAARAARIPQDSSFLPRKERCNAAGAAAPRIMGVRKVAVGDVLSPSDDTTDDNNGPSSSSSTPQTHHHFAAVECPLSHDVLQVHPRIATAGLMIWQGMLMVFFLPDAFAHEGDHRATQAQAALVVELANNMHTASFDVKGDRIYAASATSLVGYDVRALFESLVAVSSLPKDGTAAAPIPAVEPTFTVPLTCGAVWHVVVCRDGKSLLLNCSDGAIRLYTVEDCWNGTCTAPMNTFQDLVTKVKFASADLSADGEYIVGGANGADNKYELYIWNTSTGSLQDKLTGALANVRSVAWHPTRTFLAVACDDGLTDVWGPRINWTAFAPDFQALPMNVEYVEREDEFDVDEHGKHLAAAPELPAYDEDATVNVMEITPVAVFASDSENEADVFTFDVVVKNLMARRAVKNAGKTIAGDD